MDQLEVIMHHLSISPTKVVAFFLKYDGLDVWVQRKALLCEPVTEIDDEG